MKHILLTDSDDYLEGQPVIQPAIQRQVKGIFTCSFLSILSLFSVLSILAFASLGSTLSMFSSFSLLSLMSNMSALSILSHKSFMSIYSSNCVLCIDCTNEMLCFAGKSFLDNARDFPLFQPGFIRDFFVQN
ncbi:hypothetical protein BASA81_001736 [Batrachochytrium salamandrivorans]|nr:hypothetical protein BASA81_001736 [Batrachochytrium salamandrivorans]